MKRYFEERNIELDVCEEDVNILRDNTVDFVSFSYYMSGISSSKSEGETTEGNLMGSFKNPYLETSEWEWQIDPVGLRIT